jgi:hypothetical protein
MILVIAQLDIVDSRPLAPANFLCLGNKSASRRRGRDISNIHIQGHGHGPIGIGSSLKGLIDQGEQCPTMGHANMFSISEDSFISTLEYPSFRSKSLIPNVLAKGSASTFLMIASLTLSSILSLSAGWVFSNPNRPTPFV